VLTKFKELPSIKFHANPLISSQVVPCGHEKLVGTILQLLVVNMPKMREEAFMVVKIFPPLKL
jgi:hypothetical protein